MRKLFIIILMLSLWSCKKDQPDPQLVPGKYENGLIILNEGLFQQNNSSLSFYSFSESQVYQQVFQTENNRGLGDTANDMERYVKGDSAYIIIAVDISSQVEIVNAETMRSVAQIPLFDGNNAREPRSVEVLNETAYVCNFDGTVAVIDLNSYQLTGLIQVGENPNDLEIVGDQLYVINSGGLNAPNYDSTVTVINTVSKAVVDEITVRINCNSILKDEQGDLYILSNGNYADVGPAIVRINNQTNAVVDTFNLELSSWCYENGFIYFYDTAQKGVYRLNTFTESVEGGQIIDCSSMQTVFGLYLLNGHFYLVDANGYVNSSTISVFDLSGSLQYEFTAGLNTTDIILSE